MIDNRYLTREQARIADQLAIKRLGVPSIVLMENAGRGCAEVLSPEIKSRESRILICCGPGNNGGDGFVIARQLLNLGICSKVILSKPASNYSGDALTNLKILQQLSIPILPLTNGLIEQPVASEFSGLRESDWIVDAMLGTGATGALKEPFLQMVELANRSPAKKLAVDIPTGLDCDSGLANPTAFRADITCTFIAPKIGFSSDLATQFLGQVEVIGIGVPAKLITSE